jgi:MFS family permease
MLLLRNRNFALLWSGGLLSLLGDWVMITGLPLVVYQLTGSTLALGSTVIAGAVPRVLVSTFAGVFVDRWDRRRTMLVCDLLLGLGLLPLLWVNSADRLWLLGVVVVFESSVAQFYRPAEAAILPCVVEEMDLVRANALNGLNMNVARLVGPGLGALLVALGGLTAVALVDAASFALAALSVMLVRVAATPAPTEDRVWRLWQEGLQLVRREHIPRLLCVFFAITSVGEGLIATLYVPFVTRVLQGSEFTYGAMLSAQAVGGLIGSAAVGRFGGRIAAGTLMGTSAVMFGLLDLCIFYSPLISDGLALPLILMVLVGVPGAAGLAGAMTLAQKSVGDRLRGRLFGAIFAISALSMVIGTTIAGAFGDVVGIVPLLTLQGAGYIGAGALVLSAIGRGQPSPKGQVVIHPGA